MRTALRPCCDPSPCLHSTCRRLAGLPDAVVRRASSMAASLAQGATIDGEEGAREKLGSILEACRRGPKAVQAAWLSMRRPAISV